MKEGCDWNDCCCGGAPNDDPVGVEGLGIGGALKLQTKEEKILIF